MNLKLFAYAIVLHFKYISFNFIGILSNLVSIYVQPEGAIIS